MSISGHKTNSTYKRYGIIDEDVQRQLWSAPNYVRGTGSAEGGRDEEGVVMASLALLR